MTHTSLLRASPLKKAEGYSLDDEDAAIYSDAEDAIIFLLGGSGLTEPLKKKAAQSQAPQSDETI